MKVEILLDPYFRGKISTWLYLVQKIWHGCCLIFRHSLNCEILDSGQTLRPAFETGLWPVKQFIHSWNLPSCKYMETCSHVSFIQNLSLLIKMNSTDISPFFIRKEVLSNCIQQQLFAINQCQAMYCLCSEWKENHDMVCTSVANNFPGNFLRLDVQGISAIRSIIQLNVSSVAYWSFNSLSLAVAYMRHWTGSSLVQQMACSMYTTKYYLNQSWIIVNWPLL